MRRELHAQTRVPRERSNAIHAARPSMIVPCSHYSSFLVMVRAAALFSPRPGSAEPEREAGRPWLCMVRYSVYTRYTVYGIPVRYVGRITVYLYVASLSAYSVLTVQCTCTGRVSS